MIVFLRGVFIDLEDAFEFLYIQLVPNWRVVRVLFLWGLSLAWSWKTMLNPQD